MTDETDETTTPQPDDEPRTEEQSEFLRLSDAIDRLTERLGAAQAENADLARDLVAAQQRITELEAELDALTTEEES